MDKHKTIVPQILKAHEISGCDTVAYLYGIWKGVVVKKLFTEMKLIHLGNADADLDDVVSDATTFIAACYGVRYAKSMSEDRVAVRKTRTSAARNQASTLQSLPPTSEAFADNVKRAHLQVITWLLAACANSPESDPTAFGWRRTK